MTEVCGRCKQVKPHYRTAYIQGVYYQRICDDCISSQGDELSSNAAGFDRRRGYEDNAQDTIQPYDANGKPRVEFFRLYPEAAKKVFTAEQINELKRKI